MRLWVGEFYLPGGRHDAAVWFARSRFLDAVKRVAPVVLTCLRDEVRAGYLRHFRLTDLFPDPEFQVTVADLQSLHRTEGHAEIDRFLELLDRWASRFNLMDDWIKETAIATLRDWEQFPDAIQEPGWKGPAISVPAPVGFNEAVITVSDFWNPALQSWETFETLFRARCDAALREFRGRIEKLCEERRWRRVVRKRNRGGSPESHFQWLAEHQVNLLSAPQICEKYFLGSSWPDESSVRQAVRALAEFIGLTLRKPLHWRLARAIQQAQDQ